MEEEDQRKEAVRMGLGVRFLCCCILFAGISFAGTQPIKIIQPENNDANKKKQSLPAQKVISEGHAAVKDIPVSQVYDPDSVDLYLDFPPDINDTFSSKVQVFHKNLKDKDLVSAEKFLSGDVGDAEGLVTGRVLSAPVLKYKKKVYVIIGLVLWGDFYVAKKDTLQAKKLWLLARQHMDDSSQFLKNFISGRLAHFGLE